MLPAALVAAFLTSLAGTWLVIRRRALVRAVADGEDRWRTDAVPRLGGLAMLAGLLVGAGLMALGGRIETEQAAGFVAGAVLISVVGVLDDARGLRPLHKLIAQIAAAAILLATGTTVEIIPVEPFASLLTVLWVIAITNALNLIDNMDGLAAGVSFVSAVVLAAHAVLADLPEVAVVAAVIAAVLAGFLPFNMPLRGKATVYMGDGGSQLLGFSLAWLALASSWQEASGFVAAIAVPLLVLAVPILDTALVSVVRTLEGRPIHVGGRDHTSHRLVLRGLSERRAVLLLIAASAALGGSSLIYVASGSVGLALVGVALSVAVLVHFAMFLAQARRAEAPEMADRRGWLSIDTYRLHKRRFVEGVIDLLLIVAAYYLAYVLRYEEFPSELNDRLIAESLPVLLVARYLALYGFGLYRGLWRYAGMREVGQTAAAVLVSEAVTVVVLTGLYRFEDYSRSVFVINAVLAFLFLAGSRMAERGIGEWLHSQRSPGGVPRALIIGAGDAGNSLLRELRLRGEFEVVGFIDDDPAKRGGRSQGVPVLGTHADIERVVDLRRPEVVYNTLPNAPAERLERIEAACRRVGCRLTTIRDFGGILSAQPDAPPD